MSAAADDGRVQEARRRLAAFPGDDELVRLSPVDLVSWLVRMHGAAQLLDAYVRDHEPDDRRLDTIRGVLSRFDWELDDRQYTLELIDRIADGEKP